MKKKVLVILAFVCLLQLMVVASAAELCDLTATLLNQEPHPAIPGEAVKVVFQIEGLANSACGDVEIKLIESFPFTLEKGTDASVFVKSGTYVRDFGSFLLVPYKLIIDGDALEGLNKLELDVSSNAAKITHPFDIEVEDLRTDFEVSVKEYDPATRMLIFQILNIGENDVEALTIDIPTQEILSIKGSSRNIVGSLDSNDDTTFSFEAYPKDGDLRLIVTYTDGINERRTLEKSVPFSMAPFNGRGEKEGRSAWFYVTIAIVVILIFRWWRNRKNKKKHVN